MTTATLLRTLGRRWYVVFTILLITAAVLVHIKHKPSVYWSQVDVVFLIPKSAHYPNSIAETTSSVISTAGLVAEDVNRGVHQPATASSGTTIVGEGVRNGYSVRLPNAGGQWAYDFERPVLDVQVVGADASGVMQELVRIVDLIEADLHRLQASQGTRPSDFITASSAPSRAVVLHLDGHPSRAYAVTMLLGLWVAVLAAVGSDVLLRRRRRRASTSATQPRGLRTRVPALTSASR
jgi:hypothetical protein